MKVIHAMEELIAAKNDELTVQANRITSLSENNTALQSEVLAKAAEIDRKDSDSKSKLAQLQRLEVITLISYLRRTVLYTTLPTHDS